MLSTFRLQVSAGKATNLYKYQLGANRDYNSKKKQKFEVKGVEGKYIKGRLVSKNEQTMTLETKVGLQTIPVEEIYDVKVKKFSFLKSVGLIIVTPYGLAFLFLALGGGM